MTDAGDSLLYSYVIGDIAKEWGISLAMAASIGFMPMAAAIVGGPLFGYIADRLGRKLSLQLGLLIISLASFGIALAQTPTQMICARTLVGIGLGGLWTAGMTLISESWDPLFRGKAVAVVQVGFPLGYLYASLLAYFFVPHFGWRGAFVACGVPPLVVMLLVALFVRESPIWLQAKKGIEASGGDTTKVPLNELFRGGNARKVSFAALIAFLGMYGYWAVMTWIPSYLATIGFNPKEIPLWTFYILLGAIIGYLTHGAFSDRFGRRTAFSLFFLGAAGASIAFGLLPVYLSRTQGVVVAKTSILLIGPLLSFSTGYFSGYGAYYAELFPTRIRALASGFSFNIGRIGTAIGPGLTGLLAATFGVGGALATASLAFVTCALMIFALPETIGKTLED
jgi:MFS family permease